MAAVPSSTGGNSSNLCGVPGQDESDKRGPQDAEDHSKYAIELKQAEEELVELQRQIHKAKQDLLDFEQNERLEQQEKITLQNAIPRLRGLWDGFEQRRLKRAEAMSERRVELTVGPAAEGKDGENGKGVAPEEEKHEPEKPEKK